MATVVSPSGIHKTALRVQITYTLESQGTTITYSLGNYMIYIYAGHVNIITLLVGEKLYCVITPLVGGKLCRVI